MFVYTSIPDIQQPPDIKYQTLYPWQDTGYFHEVFDKIRHKFGYLIS